jgi:hypothetical protein
MWQDANAGPCFAPFERDAGFPVHSNPNFSRYSFFASSQGTGRTLERRAFKEPSWAQISRLLADVEESRVDISLIYGVIQYLD